MNIPTAILTEQGLEPTPFSAVSLTEVATHEPVGVYTIARTYQRNRVLLFDDHVDRLEESARLTGIHVRVDRPALRKALKRLIDQGGYPESRYRIAVPHEENGHTTRLFLSVEPYQPVPADILTHGARLATVQQTRATPAAKTTAWAIARQPAKASLPPGTYEGLLMTPDGALLEGLSSNFYAIQGDTLRTAGAGVLAGMAQRIVFKVAEGLLTLDQRPITLTDLPTVDEAFISSAGRGVVPIIQIDATIIGSGQPGARTIELQTRYNRWAETHLENLE